MWSQREKGALVASGVAVVQMNPWVVTPGMQGLPRPISQAGAQGLIFPLLRNYLKR
jgi:hypothetical protein